MVHIGSVHNVRIAGARGTAAGGQSKPVAAGHFRWLVGGALGAVVLLAAACGSSVATTTTIAAKSTASTVAATSRGSLGVILIDKSGRTLYRYSPDGTGKPTCTGGCAAAWPPLTVPTGTVHVTGAAGVSSADPGTVALPTGSLQVTFRGMPLYRFSGDAKPGDTNGQGTGGTWFVVPVAMVAPLPTPPATTGVATTTTPPPSSQSNRVTTAPPATAPPATAPPATSPPATAPPMTAPPATSPPVMAPPVTQPSGGGYGY